MIMVRSEKGRLFRLDKAVEIDEDPENEGMVIVTCEFRSGAMTRKYRASKARVQRALLWANAMVVAERAWALDPFTGTKVNMSLVYNDEEGLRGRDDEPS